MYDIDMQRHENEVDDVPEHYKTAREDEEKISDKSDGSNTSCQADYAQED